MINEFNKDWYRYEFHTIVYISLISIIFLLTSNNIITFYISLELYTFTTIFIIYYNWNSNSKIGLIYFLINVLGSLFIILSFLRLNYIYNIIEFKDIFYIDKEILWKILFIIGFSVKLGCVPFHFWVLPLYNKIHNNITIYQSIIPKLLYLVLISNIEIKSLKEIILLLSILSLIIGSCLGLKENRIKRILGASSIYNMGLLLLIVNYTDFIYILFIYFLNVLAIFLIFFIYESKNKEFYFDKSWKLNNLYILNKFNPMASFLYMLIILSMIGIPPLSGFFYKLNIFVYAINKAEFLWLIIAILSTVISTVYYLYSIEYMYKENKSDFNKDFVLKNNEKTTIIFSMISIMVIGYLYYMPYLFFILK